jgi:N-acetylmuramoyl-L-alanine amidase
MLLIPRRIASALTVGFLALTVVVSAQNRQSEPKVEGIRFWSFGDVTRIAVETTGDYKLYSERIDNPNRVYFDLTGLAPPSAAQHGMQTIPVGDHRIRQIRVARVNGNKTRIVFDLDSPVEVVSSQLVNPDRLMIEVRPKGTSLPALNASHSVVASHKVDLAAHSNAVDSDIAETPGSVPSRQQSQDDPNDAYHPRRTAPAVQAFVPAPPPVISVNPPATAVTQVSQPVLLKPNGVPASAASPTVANPAFSKQGIVTAAKSDSSGDRSLVRVFGLKLGRVVIDAGHGGHDSGTVGPNGLMEKELVLDVALRLGALITKQMGAEVIYTRSTDVFIPLEERTQIANDQKADLFISIHANSSSEPSASGVETYYFNLTSDKGGLDLATRENATADSSISDLNDLLHRAVLQTKREESREFAQKVQASLCAASPKSSAHSVDRGVRQAPFVVLIGATMPSILAEIGFVSNPHDERLMRRSDQRQKIADALFKGVVQYANSLSHEQIARAGTE